MIYLVSNQQKLFDSPFYKMCTVKESLELLKDCKIIQFDTETTGREPHLCQLLSMQFGSMDGNTQIVVDCSTIHPSEYKDLLESHTILGQNLKFDLQFLFNYGIVPTRIYDTMIIEQLLYLGYPSGQISYSLKAIAERRLSINIDKTVRGEIIWRGLDDRVIQYAASDVKYLYAIMQAQIEDMKKQGCLKGGVLECDAVIPIAYMEWCGIHLDRDRWKAKMKNDRKNLREAEDNLNAFVVKLSQEGYKKPFKDDLGNTFYDIVPASKFSKFVFVDRQGDLFDGYNLSPKVTINWGSSQQVVKFAKLLGFNTVVQDKKTGEDKDSVLEKQLKGQKGICDEFLKLYLGKGNPDDNDYYAGYTGSNKVVTSFGQGHLNAINPVTNRIHTVFKQLGASSGRMSCGSQQPNTDLAKVNNVNPKDCKYPNIQQLPADAPTRAAFTAEQGNLMVDCDFSALESRLGADIYNEHNMIEEFLHGSGDMHSLCAKMVFHEELKDVDVKDIKKKRPDLRKKVKPIEFSQQFGGSEFAIASSLGCSIEEAQKFKTAYDNGFKGIAEFKKRGSAFVRSHGYVLINPITGHKMYWWDWNKWKKEQDSYTPDFWDEYKEYHKGTGDDIALQVKQHFKAASKWDRMALNAPTQGTGSIIIKTAAINLFKWIMDNHLFSKVKICAMVHDELLIEFPENLKDSFPHTLEQTMFDAAAKYCEKVPIPAEAEVSDHWVH